MGYFIHQLSALCALNRQQQRKSLENRFRQPYATEPTGENNKGQSRRKKKIIMIKIEQQQQQQQPRNHKQQIG